MNDTNGAYIKCGGFQKINDNNYLPRANSPNEGTDKGNMLSHTLNLQNELSPPKQTPMCATMFDLT